MREWLKRFKWDKENNRWVIKANTKKAVRYYVQWSEILKRYTCTCPNWRYRRMGENQDCKHIHCIVEILQFGTPEELEAIGIEK